jgi:hypothetical protein
MKTLRLSGKVFKGCGEDSPNCTAHSERGEQSNVGDDGPNNARLKLTVPERQTSGLAEGFGLL